MLTVKIPFNSIKKSTGTQLWWQLEDASTAAIEMSKWCQSQGLILNRDYEWAVRTHHRIVEFHFRESARGVATLFALKWGVDK